MSKTHYYIKIEIPDIYTEEDVENLRVNLRYFVDNWYYKEPIVIKTVCVVEG